MVGWQKRIALMQAAQDYALAAASVWSSKT